jgi:hypothetical protein
MVLCLIGLPSLLFVSISILSGPAYEFSNGRILNQETGEVVDSLEHVRFVCLIGMPMSEVAGTVDRRDISGCPTIKDQGVIVGRDDSCSFYEIHSHRVLDEYDYQCRGDAQNLKQFDRYGVPTLYFDDDV